MKPAAAHPRASRRHRLVALLVSCLALLSGVPLAALPLAALPTAAAAATPPKAAPKVGALTVTVLAVTPLSPVPSNTVRTLTVTLRLRNNTAQDFPKIDITGERGTPIASQAALDHAMASTTPDPAHIVAMNSPPTVTSLAGGQTEDVVFRSTTGIPFTAGICLCANQIYPLFLSASVAQGTRSVVLGTAQTYIPAFETTSIAPVEVGWVWPLLDRPHRLTSSSLFLDDDLAAEVATGGRLDRALTVLENVAATVPMTVVTDPDLIDELEVMASGTYQVAHGTKAPTTGVGSIAAASWLQRLRTVLEENADTELDFTPYGDPDVESLQHNGLTWTAGLSTLVQQHLSAALGDVTTASDIAWPLGQTISSDTLDTLVKQGTRTVLLSDTTLPGGATTTPPLDALAPLHTPSGNAVAGITSTTIQSWAAKVVTAGGPGVTALPELVAQVALRAEQDLAQKADRSHFLVITPPRQLDVDPAAATSAILETAATFWSTPVTLHRAVQTIPPASHGALKPQAGAGLPAQVVEALDFVTDSLPGLTTLFDPAIASAQIGTLPQAAQLAASSSMVAEPDRAVSYALKLRAQVRVLRSGVHLKDPGTNASSGSYTLTSNNSSLPVTIANDLAVAVTVNVNATAVGGLPGFVATPIQGRSIAAKSTVQVKLPIHFDRAGRIQVAVQLTTPSGLTLGRPITLKVHNTALGTVGVVITAVAAVVLVIALLVRVLTRLRRRAAKAAAA